MAKKNNDFFVEKKAWSVVKDELLGCYFMPYVSKILHTYRPLVYVDCFAGKGKFDDGNPGSPLIALEVIDKCQESTSMESTQIEATFIDLNYADDLRNNLQKYPWVNIISGKYEDNLANVLQGKERCNVFLYIDPYGIKALKCSIFDELSKKHFNSIELLINMNSFGFIREACHALGTSFNDKAIHRLSAADEVATDFVLPFCLLLFRNPSENDQFTRAIFHNINAKQIPLKLEENLKVILESPQVFSDDTLVRDPSFGWKYYLARKTLQDIDFTYFPAINSYIRQAKYSFFVELFGFLLKNQSVEENDSAITKVKTQLVEVERALVESEITATTTNIAVIGALAYYRLTNESKYRGFLSWIKKNNIGNVEKLHIDDVINLYDEIYEHVPKKVFLARWYPSAEHDGDDEYRKAESRISAIKEIVQQLNLELTDLGTRETGTFDIRDVMYHDIRECDIFIADLSGARHNVMIEVGYALKHVKTARMLFYFQASDKCTSVPFDVSHLNYVPIVDSAEIKTSVKTCIENILEQARNGEI